MEGGGSPTYNMKTSTADLFLERGVQQKVHYRWALVTRYKAFAEIACEVVVGRGGTCLDKGADRARESLLHLQPRKRVDDFRYRNPSRPSRAQCLR
jgi:hypothetical protein